MKATEIVNHNGNEINVDWDVPQWLTYVDSDGIAYIVLSTGDHSEVLFTGTCLPNRSCKNGAHGKDWIKNKFSPIQESLTIKIAN